MAEYGAAEVVNISKIKDGFFVGDEATASNLDVIITFKITHIINACGNQVMNAWETIGIKYLTLNWTENINQNLFDNKDEIANRIQAFIDDSSINGEGLLIHSLKGHNRACCVVLIYLLKKYRWTISKCLEFLNSKKPDVEVMKNFMSQINMFEARLSKIGVGPKSNDWNEINGNDPDEMMMRNTYLNGLQGKVNYDGRSERSFFGGNKKVNWNDINSGKKEALIHNTFHVDLFIQKEVKPVTTHKKLRPSKSIMKNRPNSVDVRRSNNLNMNNVNVNQQMSSYINNQNYNQMYNNNVEIADKSGSNRVNNFIQNNHANPPPRSFSLDQKVDNRKNNLMNNFQDKEVTTNIQIITPNVNSIINNNYNNIYIQSPTEMDFKKLNQIYSPETQNKLNSNMMMNNQGMNNSSLMNNRLASAGRKDNPPVNNPNLNSYNYNPKNNFISSNLTGTQSKNDVQKLPNNSLINSYDPKQIKVIDYSNSSNFMPQSKNISNFNNYSAFGNNQQKSNSNSTNISTEKPKSTFLKDYQSEIKKPQIGSNPNSYSLMSKNKSIPVKLQNDEFDKKSDQLINNFTMNNRKPGNNYITGGSNIQSITNNYSNSNNMGTIKRSSSKPTEERPSTAPAKENKPDDKNFSGHSSLKRLPSPAVKSNNLLSNTTKNISNTLGHTSKYRAPSPANPLKTNTFNNNKIGLSNSLKNMPMNTMMKNKWK